MGEKDFRISAEELDRIEIQCPACASAIIFAPKGRGPGDTQCPDCSTPMPALASLVTRYRMLIEECSAYGDGKVHFLIRLDND